jgi:hypothetical protein
MILGHIITAWTTQTGWHDPIQQVPCTLTADGHKVTRSRRQPPWVVIALPDGATVFGHLSDEHHFHPGMTLGPSGYRRAQATIPANAPLRTMTPADEVRLAAFERLCRAAAPHGGTVPYEDRRGFSA